MDQRDYEVGDVDRVSRDTAVDLRAEHNNTIWCRHSY